MEPDNKSMVTRIQPEPSDSPITITVRKRDVAMHYIFDQELESIGSASVQSSLHLAFFGVTFGAALALWITIATVVIENPMTYSAFWAGSLLSTVLTFYFGIRAFIDMRKAKRQIASIRDASLSREIESKSNN